MTTQQRNDIEVKIQAFEPGRFQEFMLRLLPLYDKKYEGMRRNGHNENSKTRRGVPDLIKYYENGSQVACECGTEERYWNKSKQMEEWKPIADLTKCLSRLKNLTEIVLASNQPMPPSSPNIKHDIISHAREICLVTIFSSEDLATWIEINKSKPEILELIKEYFPDIAELERLRIENLVLKEKAIAVVTGGNGFCYLRLEIFNGNDDEVFIHNPGKYPLYSIEAKIVDLDMFDSTKNLFGSQFLRSYGEIPANHTRVTSTRWILGEGLKRKFNIFWTARNGSFTQILRFRKVGSKWSQALKVIRDN